MPPRILPASIERRAPGLCWTHRTTHRVGCVHRAGSSAVVTDALGIVRGTRTTAAEALAPGVTAVVPHARVPARKSKMIVAMVTGMRGEVCSILLASFTRSQCSLSNRRSLAGRLHSTGPQRPSTVAIECEELVPYPTEEGASGSWQPAPWKEKPDKTGRGLKGMKRSTRSAGTRAELELALAKYNLSVSIFCRMSSGACNRIWGACHQGAFSQFCTQHTLSFLISTTKTRGRRKGEIPPTCTEVRTGRNGRVEERAHRVTVRGGLEGTNQSAVVD
jgi:hypothetical protein